MDRNKEDDIDRHVGPGKAPHERWQVDTSRAPMLPRPLSQVNCVQVMPEADATRLSSTMHLSI